MKPVPTTEGGRSGSVRRHWLHRFLFVVGQSHELSPIPAAKQPVETQASRLAAKTPRFDKRRVPKLRRVWVKWPAFCLAKVIISAKASSWSTLGHL